MCYELYSVFRYGPEPEHEIASDISTFLKKTNLGAEIRLLGIKHLSLFIYWNLI
jgi:hypothetical protein